MKWNSKIASTLLVTALFWTASVEANTLSKISCSLKPIHSHNTPPEAHGVLPHILVSESTSLNWSGYVSATNLQNPSLNSVKAVSGTWTVPHVIQSSSSHTYSSLWVGIDGYTNGTVEQIGTEHDWSSGQQQNYAWFEMYPKGAYEIVGFPVNAGDSITASVTYLGTSVFKLTITNNTRHVTYTVPRTYTISTAAQRSSAEWIMEAPYLNGVLPLADFGTAGFTNCSATINGRSGAINNSHWQYDALSMQTQNSIIKSLASSLYSNGKAFSLTWQHE